MVARRKTKRRPPPAPKAAAVVGTSANATGSGLRLDVVTAARGLNTDEYLKRLRFPGEPPLTRGIRATMYRGRLWTMRPYAGFGTAKETNRRPPARFPPRGGGPPRPRARPPPNGV